MLRLLSISFFLVVSLSVNAQNLFGLRAADIGFKVGVSNYQGDLVKEHINIAETNFALGVQANVMPNEYLSLSLGINSIKITGDDRNYGEMEEPGRYIRALKMENRLLEISARAHVYPLMRRSPLFKGDWSFQPYLGTGVSLVFSNPELEDLNESDGISVSLKESPIISIPLIAGIRYFMKPEISVFAETAFSVAFSDRLDGYEFLEKNDWFMFHSIGMNWHISDGSDFSDGPLFQQPKKYLY